MLLNINFNSILTQILRPASAPAENKPLAVLGMFYSRLFAYTASLIENIKDEPELTATEIKSGLYEIKDSKGNKYTTATDGYCSCYTPNCNHQQLVHSLSGFVSSQISGKTKIKSPALRKIAARLDRSWELVEF